MAIDWTKPIETMEGKPARVLATDLKDRVHKVVVAIDNGDYEHVECLMPSGASNGNTFGDPIVRNKRVKVRGYVGVRCETHVQFDNEPIATTTAIYSTRAAAESIVRNGPEWRVIPIEWEESP